MSPSPEEAATRAAGADAGSMISVDVRVLAGGAGADSVIFDDVPAVADGANAGFVIFVDVRVLAAGAGADSVISDEVRAVAAGADCGVVSVSIADVSVSAGDDVSRGLVDVVCRSRLRNRRHVSELCSRLAPLAATAGFAPNASLVSTSSCPVTPSPLRTW